MLTLMKASDRDYDSRISEDFADREVSATNPLQMLMTGTMMAAREGLASEQEIRGEGSAC